MGDFAPYYCVVDPGELRVPTSRPQGADPGKLQRQISLHGRDATDGMPDVQVRVAADGALGIVDGVTRATRLAKLSPGTLIRVQVIGRIDRARGSAAKIREVLP